jgi:hypothetical protein
MAVDHDALKKQVIKHLTLCERMNLPGQKPDIDDQQVIQLYVVILAKAGISAEVLAEAGPEIFAKERFFHHPATLVEHCEPIRARRAEEAKAAYYARLVACHDADGNPMAALPERVRDGILLPDGDMSGNGKPAPELPATITSRDDARVNALLRGSAAPLNPEERPKDALPAPRLVVLTNEKREPSEADLKARVDAIARYVKNPVGDPPGSVAPHTLGGGEGCE